MLKCTMGVVVNLYLSLNGDIFEPNIFSSNIKSRLTPCVMQNKRDFYLLTLHYNMMVEFNLQLLKKVFGSDSLFPPDLRGKLGPRYTADDLIDQRLITAVLSSSLAVVSHV